MENKKLLKRRLTVPWRKLEVAFLIFTLLFIVFSFITIGTSFFVILRAVLYLVFGLLLPGYLLARVLVSEDNASELYGFSLLFGIGLAIACYFLDSFIVFPFLPRRVFCLFTGPMLSVPALKYLISDYKTGKISSKALIPDVGELFLIALSLCFAFAASALQSGISATRAGTSSAYHDTLWIISNTASLSHGWPADNMQYFGKSLNSNIFASIFRVSLSRFIGSTAAETMFVFSSLYYVPLLIFALDALALSFIGDKKKYAHLYTATVIFVGFLSRAIMFFYDLDRAYRAYSHAYICTLLDNLLYLPNGIDLAVPACALLVLIIIKVFKQNKLSYSALTAVFIAAAVLSGAKFVFTVCLIAVLITSALLHIILRNGKTIVKQISVITIIVSCAFAITYFFVVSGGEVYLPATNAFPTFYHKEDPEYRKATMAFLDELDRKNYEYILFTSGEKTDPNVRQDGSGYYYIGGMNITGQSVDESTVLHMLRVSEIDTGGLLNGSGGTKLAYLNSYSRINNAFGFIRISGRNGAPSRLLFYGRNLSLSRIGSLSRAKKLLFSYGSEGTEYSFQQTYASFKVNAASEATEVFKWIHGTVPTPKSNLMTVYLILFIPVFLFMARPVTTIPFFIWTAGKIKRFKQVTSTEMLLCGMALCGLIGYFFLDINGFSQAYFFISAAIFFDLIGIKWLCDNYERISKFDRVLLWSLVTVAVATTVLALSYQGVNGARQVYHVYTQRHQEDSPGDDLITNYEMTAMDWLRTNTPEDAVVAYNRVTKSANYNSTEQPLPNDYAVRYYYYTAYSERQAFLGAWAYMPRTQEMQEMLRERKMVNDALFNQFCSNRRELMESNSISYLVVSAYIWKGYYLDDPDLEVVFRNRDIVIYHLKDTAV